MAIVIIQHLYKIGKCAFIASGPAHAMFLVQIALIKWKYFPLFPKYGHEKNFSEGCI